MKLIKRGKYISPAQLPQAELPPNAVRFCEPEDVKSTVKASLIFCLPALFFILLASALAFAVQGGFPFSAGKIQNLFFATLGCLLSFLFVLPHELLHGVCFGRDSEVHLFYALKDGAAFVVCTEPVTKRRFIWLSLCPNIVLAALPLLLWAIFPMPEPVSICLFFCCSMLLLMGCGDYMNVKNAIVQMPKGSMQQLSGFHSYWFIPEESQRERQKESI